MRAGWKRVEHATNAGAALAQVGTYSAAVWRRADGTGWTWHVRDDARGRAYNATTYSRSGTAWSRSKAKRMAERAVAFLHALRAIRRRVGVGRRREAGAGA